MKNKFVISFSTRHASDPGPGMVFEEGQTRVMYIAEDSSGNSARCDVIVNVRGIKKHLYSNDI